ncbi:MAG: PAS domain-containing sensor histidine kinase [Halodesulfurarchaeum sp.]|nr:PAS domain-containing sensor histidine kinase [Halodesulfurarchaeum sp.]
MDGQFLAVNDAAVDRLGYDEETLLWMDVSEIDSPMEAGKFVGRVARLEESGSVTFETSHVPEDGTEIPVEVTASLVEYFGQPAVLNVARDIADRKTHERALEHENERLEEFASIVSHDLRNPLTVAEGRIELARETSEDEHLATAAEALERSQRLIEDVLELAREGEPIGDLEPVEVGAIEETAWGHVAKNGGNLVVEADGTIVADASRLQQLFENLLRNAVEHTDGAVTVTVGDLKNGFYVVDDGPGIPEADRESIFDVGFSTGEGSTGLGLNIVSQIANAHGWEIVVTDSETGGTRFKFTGIERPEA